MSDFADVLRAPPEAREVTLAPIAGEVPPGLRGTLLRNGPGAQHAGSTPLHFLDGYPLVASVRFEDGQAVHHAREVALPITERERAAGRLLARRPFTNRPGGRLANFFRLAVTTTAAHDVYTWAGAVVAADVSGHHLLDPRTLDTTGPAPLNRMLGGLTQLSPMPRIDRFGGGLVAYAMTPGMLGSDSVTVVELDRDWKETARVTRSLGVKGALLHDLVATEHHYVIAQLGLLDVGAAAGGGGVLLDAVRAPAGGARLVAIPRSGPGPLRSLPLPAEQQGFHVANAYEEGGTLVADGTLYEGLLDFHPLDPPGAAPRAPSSSPARGPFLARHTLDLATGAHSLTVHHGAPGEAPSVRDSLHGRRHRFAYVSAPGSRGDEPVANAYYWYHGLGKLDCDAGTTVGRWDAGPRVFVSAPQFVARGEAEDDGWVLAWTHDAAERRGELVILDAEDLARGPICRLALPAPLPPASHVDWLPA